MTQRVAIIFNDTDRPDTTGIYCRRAFGEFAQVEHFRPADLERMPREGFDLYLSIDDGFDYELPADIHPLAGWLIDTHMNFDWCLHRARQFDFVFAAQRDGAEALRKHGISNVAHLPLACDPEMHKKHDVAKEYDICFVGNMCPGPRQQLVKLLQDNFASMFVGRGFFEKMAEIYSNSRLVFNRSIKNDVNMRVFEALSCGSLLLTNELRDNGQDELFRDGVHLATYRDEVELLDKTRFYLKEDTLREEIAARGRAEALARHTYRHRMERLLSTVQERQSKTTVAVCSPPEPDYGLTSIVIVTHNQLEFTRRCVNSIHHCTEEPFELIFVDNGSSDGTLEYIDRLRRAGGIGSQRSEVGDQRSEIHVIANRGNRGFPAAANQGIRAAKGRQILLLNNDTVVTPGWLRHLLEGLYRDGAIGLVGPVSNNVSGEQQVAVDYQDLSQLDVFAGRWAESQRGALVDSNRLVGFCLLIKREVVDKIGLLDEQFGIGCFEDDDYTHRALQAGYRAVIARNSFIHHFGGMTFRNSNINFAALMAENRRKFEAKWAGGQRSEIRSQRSEGRASESGAEPCHVIDAADVGTAIAPSPPLPFSPSPLPRRPTDGTQLISCCMIVRNNARYIAECVTSVLPWVDQLIVADTGSTDGTDQICRELGAEVYYFPWCDDFSAARNESLKYAKGTWIFWIDSDDVLPPESGQAMRDLLQRSIPPNIYGFTMKVHWPVPGEEGEYRATQVDHVKLFLNHPAHRFEHRIHEQILGPIRRNGGDILMTDIRIIHKNHDHSFEGQKRKLERDLRILHLEENDLPTHPFTMFNLGMTYSNKADRPGLGDRSDLEKAKHYLHRALQFAGPHDSTTPPCYALLVSCHRRLGEEEQAWYICNKGLGKFPLDHDLRYRKAMMLRDQGGPSLEQAVKVLRDILDRPEARHMSSGDYGMGSFLTRHALAEIHVRLGQWKEAEAQWRRAVKEVPEFEPGWHNLALALHEQKNWETAESTAREMIGRPQRRVQALGFRLLAHSLGALGRVEEARSCWRSLLQLVPTDAEALQRLNGQAS